ncbi:MAG TPA: type VI secretion system accessory protein TagJ [Blastocatellia bacterium]
MPTAKELFDSGQLQAAIEEVTREVKANPTDTSRRIFLFGLLCFAGEWDRAEKQLDVIGDQDPQSDIGARIYRHNIAAERKRRRTLAGNEFPDFILEPPAYIALQLKALGLIGAGDFTGARALLDRAAEESPVLTGTLDGEPFRNFRDADDLINCVMEVFLQGEYIWLPFEQIRSVEISPPAHLRDLIWTQARIQIAGGVNKDTGESADAGAIEAFIPVLYANSHQDENDQARLGRMTDWRRLGDEVYAGVGQRLFLVGDGDKAILEIRSVDFK